MLNSTVHNKLYGQFGFRILFHERTDCCSWLHAQGVIVVKTGIQCFFSGGWNPTVFFHSKRCRLESNAWRGIFIIMVLDKMNFTPYKALFGYTWIHLRSEIIEIIRDIASD